MTGLSATARALLAGRVVRRAELLFLDFVGRPSRYWGGFGPLTTRDGTRWIGTDRARIVGTLPLMIGTTSPKMTLTLSSLDPAVVTLAQQQSSLVKGRPVSVYWLFLDEKWQQIEDPWMIYAGIMDLMTYRMSIENGARTYTVAIDVEGLLTDRNRPSAGYYDPQDQASRGFLGDTGLDQNPTLIGKTIVWRPS